VLCSYKTACDRDACSQTVDVECGRNIPAHPSILLLSHCTANFSLIWFSRRGIFILSPFYHLGQRRGLRFTKSDRTMPPRSIEEYQVGWVCALPKEMTAARAMLDEEYEPFKSHNANDNNNYVLGRVGEHNVVMACLPAGVYGTNTAATAANNMQRTFTGICFGLIVGIGGAIPNVEKEVDIRLGDVVVSQPDKTHGGVIQYDLGKNLGGGSFERKGFLRPPPTVLLTALSNLQSQHDLDGSKIPKFPAEMIKRRPNLAKSGYECPGPEKDSLFCSHLEGVTGNAQCTRCQDGTIQREARADQHPVVHYGVIASGNELIKNAVERDRLGEELGAKCVEMEAAGLMNEFPCIVIRGMCDYADTHKNDVWQKYAATTAAAFAKELLSVVRPTEVAGTKRAADVMS
jgi:nucleoside phosphorylase